MKRLRKKPDYTAAVLVRDGEITRRAVEIRVRGKDIYAVQPHSGLKVSYHESGRYHLKVNHRGKAVVPIQRTPPPLVEKAEGLWTMSIDKPSRLPLYRGQHYDETLTFDIEHLPRKRLALALAIGRDFHGLREEYPPDSEETMIVQYVLRQEVPKICVLVRVKRNGI